MQFQTDGNLYKAVSISGPTHNFLGLSLLQTGEYRDPSVEVLILNPKEPKRLIPDEVVRWVKVGLETTNLDLKTNYQLKTIQFVASDSPPPEKYAVLTRSIIERLHRDPDGFNGSTP